MASKDTFHQNRPELNAALAAELGRPPATSRRGPGATASQTARSASAQLLRLARRLGSDPEELAARIPADTLRRLKYPVIEQVEEDGKRAFRHDLGIADDGRISG